MWAVVDLRAACRGLRRSPGFTVAAILTLGLGVSANTVVYSIVDAVLWQTPPVAGIQRMVSIYGRGNSGPEAWVDVDDLREIRSARTLRDVLGYIPTRAAIASGDRTDICFGEIGTPNYFEALGLRPILGRTFLPEEQEDPDAVVISASLWQEVFDGSASVIGETLLISGRPFVVVGVAPLGFNGLNAPTVAPKKYFLPLEAHHVVQQGGPPGAMLVRAFLEEGSGLDAARAELRALAANLEHSRPTTGGWPARQLHVALSSSVRINEQFDTRAMPLATAALIAVGLVQLIVCANILVLLLSRAHGRRHELSVYAALGAGRTRLVWLGLTEPIVIVFLGGVLSLLLTFPLQLLTEASVRPVVDGSPFVLQQSISSRTVAFIGAISALSLFLVGTLPALRTLTHNGDLGRRTPHQGACGLRWTGGLFGLLIALQVAGSVGLLSVAGNLSRGALRDARIDWGVNSGDAAFMVIESNINGLRNDQWRHFVDAVLREIRRSEKILLAGAATQFPGTGPARVFGESTPFAGNRAARSIHCTGITDLTLETVGIRLLSGRAIAREDLSSPIAPALVSRSAAEGLWPQSVPIGERIRASCTTDDTSLEVVGVVENTVPLSDRRIRMQMFVPLWRTRNSGEVWFFATTRGRPGSAAYEMLGAVRRANRGVAVSRSGSVDEYLKEQSYPTRAGAVLFSSSGLLGLLIATLGVYGSVAYGTSRRTREFSIRLALGAKASHIVMTALAGTLAGIVVGSLSGVLTAQYALLLLSRLANLPVQVQSSDLAPSTTAGLLLVVVSGIAGYLPARRASRSDPAKGLKEE